MKQSVYLFLISKKLINQKQEYLNTSKNFRGKNNHELRLLIS
jgi:hypothetical protein